MVGILFVKCCVHDERSPEKLRQLRSLSEKDNIWLFVPVQKLKEFFTDFMKYPYQVGSSLTVSNINYQTLKVAEAMKRLSQVEELAPPRN